MKLIFLSIVLLFHLTAYGQDINERVSVSKKIMKIYQEVCPIGAEKNKETTAMKEAFELAASYIIHGEYNNMKEQLLKARLISQNGDCQQSIDNFLR